MFAKKQINNRATIILKVLNNNIESVINDLENRQCDIDSINIKEESQDCTILSISANFADKKAYLELYQYLKNLHHICDIEMIYA